MGFFNESSWKTKEARQPSIAHCGLCGLNKKCFSPRMPPSGEGKRKILFVSEAPSEEEDRQGSQLVGESGILLRKLLFELDVDLDDCWTTNAVICRPPNHEIDKRFINSCRPNLLKTIKELQPNVIVCMGRSSVESLIGPLWKKDAGPLDRWVGWTVPLRAYNAWVCPTYHPSHLLRKDEDELLVNITLQQLDAAVRLETTPPTGLLLSDLEQEVEIILNESSARTRLKELLGKRGRVAFDYETTGLKPERKEQRIVSCSFCFEGEDTFAFQVTDGTMKLLSKVLRSRDLLKIASNLKFEERWTIAKMGHGVEKWDWDTMQAAHILDNRRGVTSVKFQAFIHLGIGEYNASVGEYLRSETTNGLNRIYDIDVRDLLLYNGLDSLLEYKVAEVQKELMGWER